MRKFNITVNGTTYEVDVEEVGGAAPVMAAASPAPASTPAPAPKKAASPAVSGPAGAIKVTAPMPGTIVSVKVNVGDAVKADTVVAVLEAMKMENEIFAGKDGTISSVNVSGGNSVNSGDVIVTMN